MNLNSFSINFFLWVPPKSQFEHSKYCLQSFILLFTKPMISEEELNLWCLLCHRKAQGLCRFVKGSIIVYRVLTNSIPQQIVYRHWKEKSKHCAKIIRVLNVNNAISWPYSVNVWSTMKIDQWEIVIYVKKRLINVAVDMGAIKHVGELFV